VRLEGLGHFTIWGGGEHPFEFRILCSSVQNLQVIHQCQRCRESMLYTRNVSHSKSRIDRHQFLGPRCGHRFKCWLCGVRGGGGEAKASRSGAPERRQTSCWRVSNSAAGVVARRQIYWIASLLGTSDMNAIVSKLTPFRAQW
jgi:hypothetical protein